MQISKTLPPLVPGIKRGAFRADELTNAPALEYVKSRPQVLRRDGYTCKYCGFTATGDESAPAVSLAFSGYLEVHHKNDNHKDNSLANLITVCPLCHMVFHLGFAGHRKNCTMILLRAVSQADLNLLVNCLAVAISRGGDLAPEASAVFDRLQSQGEQMESAFGHVAFRDPAKLACAIGGLEQHEYGQRISLFSSLRVLPYPEQFEQAISFWSDHTWLAGADFEQSWQRVYRQWQENN